MQNFCILIPAFVFLFSLPGCEFKHDQPVRNVEVKALTQKTQREQDSSYLTISYVMGQFDPSLHPDFCEIPIKYADRKGMFIRKDALESFQVMYESALLEGIKLQIRSATRNFEYQKGIWERKWNGTVLLSDGTNVSRDIKDPEEKALRILEYSSMPGTSRHHWGTDIDLNSFNNEWFNKGEGLKLYLWLQSNASHFGFCQPYTAFSDERPSGYFEEKWHWTYMPVSQPLTLFAKENIHDEMITGFLGSNTAASIGVVKKYILGINQNCL
ncbi:MAG TPA: M15 family metallopeptidase [Saprospiraceae bacterium]|nr:M15 family metallopeptidase [Saprospiraceae bacterium]